MSSFLQQRSLRKSATVRGFGYFSGRDVAVEFRPSLANTGLTFIRTDIGDGVRIPVSVDYRVDVDRRTVLQRGDVRVEMVEHVLAALAGAGIDNCEIRVDASEMPACDGSAQAFTDALAAAGTMELLAPRRRVVVDRTVRVGDRDAWIEARPTTCPGLTVDYHLDYGDGPIGRQEYQFGLTESAFRDEITQARTFLLQEEAVELAKQGIGDRVTSRDLLVFGKLGVIDNRLRFEDECVRHKILDIVGDLALAGCDIVADIVAHRTGHRSNAALVAAILDSHAIEFCPPLQAVA